MQRIVRYLKGRWQVYILALRGFWSAVAGILTVNVSLYFLSDPKDM